MKLQRRTFMKSAAATLASLFGLDAMEEILDRAGPRKVMVPGITFDDCLAGARKIVPATAEQVRTFAPYRTKNYNPIPGSLQQELEMQAKGAWRTGSYMGREGATIADLFSEGKLPIGCALGPRAKLVFVDEARKTLRFELSPVLSEDYYRRSGLGAWPGGRVQPFEYLCETPAR